MVHSIKSFIEIEETPRTYWREDVGISIYNFDHI